jgi:hypothetical protein
MNQVMPKVEITTQRIQRHRIATDFRFPSVSIFMPFNPKMEMKSKLAFSLSKITDKAITELKDKYPGEMSLLLIHKLRAIVKNLDFSTHRKSLAIFASPVFEKIYYLNIDLEETVIVNESLQIINLLFNRKHSKQFHILMLGEKESRIFLSDTNSSIKISSESLISKNIWRNCYRKNTGYLTNTSIENEIPGKTYLPCIDNSLVSVLKHEILPVFVMGTENLIRQFKNITKNNEAIIEYVTGDFEEHSLKDLKQYLETKTNDWQKIKQKIFVYQLKDAASKNKLVFGRKQVQQEVWNHQGWTLLIEKKYLYDVNLWQNSLLDFTILKTYNKFSCIKNSIDEVIEEVLKNGGNVELVPNGFLREYGQIALIKKFNK